MTGTVLFFVYTNKYICANRIEGARRYAERVGWNLQAIDCNSGPEKIDFREILDFWKPIGVIAECGGGDVDNLRRAARGLPIVYLDDDPSSEGRDFFVNSNSAKVGEIAARELLSMGVPDYAFVGWRRPRFWSEDRRRAFEAALRVHGKGCAVFDCPATATDAARRSLLSAWLKDLPKPCGLFAANDPAAEDVLQVAVALGIRVPDDLAVIGVDDDPVICERTNPSLTSIRLDFEHGGYLCAELLDRRLKDPSLRQATLIFDPIFVARRASTRRFPQCDRRVVRAIELIRRKACDGVGTPDVAREMGLSRRMAEIVFRRQTGHSIHDEIAAVRMERVESLLRNPRQEIGAIAGLCGWASGAVLRKLFKDRHDGLSMREWRQRAADARVAVGQNSPPQCHRATALVGARLRRARSQGQGQNLAPPPW